MTQMSGVIVCLSYILGLLLTAVPGGGAGILGLGIIGAVFFRRVYRSWWLSSQRQKATGATKTLANSWQNTPDPRVWIVAGLVGLLATFYFQWRVPQPEVKDVSKFVVDGNKSHQEQLVIVRGEVASHPRMTRSHKGQFWLKVTQLDEVKNEEGQVPKKGVSGKLYVTVPILQATGLYSGQQIQVTGVLYQPKAASNPGGFDFQKYLQQEGTFAGLAGQQVSVVDEERPWGWWQVREIIVRSQVRFLGVPEGPLVSAMVLGSKAVDLPYDVRDLFVKAGLAHALAASGFQTSLILGVILQLTKRAKKVTQISLGVLSLITFLCLTGFQPAVLRAVIMGFAALVGLALERRIQQLGSLLLAATILLIVNPLWIWDLGFQLSFLATLGLVTTVSPITKRLDWIPPLLASAIAVPLAATIWTLPLQLLTFGVVPTYSLPLNIISTPLISFISLGGMVSALASLILPSAGSTLASFLYYPTHWLIQLVDFFGSLPGNAVVVGSIATWQMLTIYSLIILSWLVKWWQKRWFLAGFISIVVVLIPFWHSANNLLRITLLATRTEPVLVVQVRGNNTLINSGDEGTGRFTVLPFLQQQGINQIDWAIASKFPGTESNGWLNILQNINIQNFYHAVNSLDNELETQIIQKELQNRQGSYQPLTIKQAVEVGSTMVEVINDQLPILKLQIFDQTWLFVGRVQGQEIAELLKTGDLFSPQVLWCPPESLLDLVVALKPQVAIAPSGDLDAKTLSALDKAQTQIFLTGRDGAIQWTPEGNFETFMESTENQSSFF
jgi:competence protein ComEC